MTEMKHKTFGSVGAPEPEVELTPKPEHIMPDTMDIFDLQSLIELGRIQDTIKIGNFIFELATLDDTLQTRAYEVITKDEENKITLRRIIVALSLVSINGRTPEEIIKEGKTSEEKRLYLVEKLQGSVMEQLIDFYDKLLERSQKEISNESVKN
jgi:hypothetical protein